MNNMKYSLISLVLGLFIISCQSNGTEEGTKVKKDGFTKSDIIRMPVSADEPLDSTLVAKMEFEEYEYDFGTLVEGKFAEHVFKFTNTGKVPLLIADAKTVCGCTVPSYPKEPIAPGESGEVLVKFNSAGKKKEQNRPVSLIANTIPAKTVLTMKGYVHNIPGQFNNQQ